MKLPAKQKEILEVLMVASSSAYLMRVSLAPLHRLTSKRLIEPIGLGHIASPRTARYCITEAGRAALEQEG